MVLASFPDKLLKTQHFIISQKMTSNLLISSTLSTWTGSADKKTGDKIFLYSNII